MNKALLWLLMLFKGGYARAGADVEQMRAILRIKLMLDDRKPLNTMSAKSKKPSRFSSFLVVLMSFFSGLAFILPMVLMTDELLGLVGYFTMFAFFLTIMLVTDFVTVLIDTRDKSILFARPVSDKTFFLARMVHIIIYFIRIVLPMMLPGWITASILWQWKGFVYMPIAVVLLMMTVLFAVLGLYMLLLRIVKPEKFREVISYFQIVFSVFIFGMYYLMPRFMDSAMIEQLQALKMPWLRWLPTYWIAAIWTWLQPQMSTLPYTQWLAVVAIIFPLVSIYVAVKYLAPSFVARLSVIGSSSENTNPVKVAKYQSSKGKALYQRLSAILNKDVVAQAGFNFAWLQTGRSRMFKMRVYPSFGYVPIYFLYFFFTGGRSFAAEWNSLADSSRHIGLLYMSGFVMIQCINYITYSDQYKASWIFFMARTPHPGTIMGGAFKAAYLKYFVPFFALIVGFVLYTWGMAAIADIILAGLNVTFFTLLLNLVSFRYLPFSRIEQMKGMSGRTLVAIASLILAGGMGFGHFLALKVAWLKGLFIVLSAILLWMCWDSYTKTTWDKIRADE